MGLGASITAGGLVALGLLGAGDASATVPRLLSVVKCRDARQQLEEARQLRKELVGAPVAQRPLLRERAVAGYRAVVTYWPGAAAVAAEAAFRAGELLRASDQSKEALECFGRAVTAAPGSEWHARARLEEGHLHRRAERWTAALASYSEVASGHFLGSRRRDEALRWIARVEELRGRPNVAMGLLRHAASETGDVVQRSRAFEQLVRTALRVGDQEAATEASSDACRQLGRVAAEHTERGHRVRAMLDRMHRSVASIAPTNCSAAHEFRFSLGLQRAPTDDCP